MPSSGHPLYDVGAPRTSARRTGEVTTSLEKESPVAYVISEPCIGTKDTSCVDVCPVDCIHPRKDEAGFEAATQLYIHPDECIDCGACVPACPVEAIFAQDEVPEKWKNFIDVNAQHFRG